MWVHPSDGMDPDLNDQTQWLPYINDSSLKFRTLGVAIEASYQFLVLQYDAATNPDQYAVVYALPGAYSSVTNGEALPIQMRDRVHVQGVGARRCVIRGASTTSAAATNISLNLPTAITAPGLTRDLELLVDYTLSTPAARIAPSASTGAPWHTTSPTYFWHNDTAEVLDGFTLQGGDVHVYMTNNVPASNDYFPASRISNCIFDLRHQVSVLDPAGNPVTLTGPSIGIFMQRKPTFDSAPGAGLIGYLDSRVLIAHNTFIFARWNGGDPLEVWASESRPETVGVIDVTENCPAGFNDVEDEHRGVGSPCLVANVFRTRGLDPQDPTPQIRPFAMLGIAAHDTSALLNGVGVDTNAYDPARVGWSNGYFFSQPTTSVQVSPVWSSWPHWNCHTTSFGGGCLTQAPSCSTALFPAQPAVHIWDGVNGVDPGFVGEYLATSIAGLGDYVDWRILPGSPLENLSFLPPSPGPRAYITAPHASDPKWTYRVNEPEDLYLFSWDGEHWGNGRVMAGAPDLGFDERGLLIQAGNWANDSGSHNQPGFMHPFVGVGKPERYFILPENAGGVSLTATGRHLRLQDVSTAPPAPSTGDGWIHPPGAQGHPTNLASLPVGYRAKYINYATTAWHVEDLSVLNVPGWQPLNSVPVQSALPFLSFSVPDDECSTGVCTHTYFNLQGLVVDGATSTTALLRSNMIGEYR